MSLANPRWGAPRIHGELLKLGFDVSERSVSRWIRRAPKDPDPLRRWLVFLRNHREAIAAMDLFTVPTKPEVCRKAPKIDLGQPPAVDLSVAPVARLALGVGHRQARNGRSLASCCLSFVLDLEGALRKTRATRHFKRSPRSDSQDMPGESRLGCAPHPRRTAQTGHRHRAEQCQQIYGACRKPPSQTWRTFLAGEPCPAVGLDRLFTVPTIVSF